MRYLLQSRILNRLKISAFCCNRISRHYGIIKAAMGFRGFSLRGKEKVSSEWTLVCLAYNLRRLHRLVRGAKNGVPTKPQPPSMGWNSLRISLARECPRKAIPNIFRRLHGLAAESTANLALTPTGS
jgi:hypothetical protein